MKGELIKDIIEWISVTGKNVKLLTQKQPY